MSGSIWYTENDDLVHPIRDAVRKGKIFDVQEWIKDKKPVFSDSHTQFRRDLLRIAVEKGCHSMVQILAEVWPDQKSLDNALSRVVDTRRVDLIWLLIENGADLKTVSLGDLARCYDRDLIKYIFDNWDQYGYEMGLAEIIIQRIRVLPGLIKDYAPKLPNSEIELAQALKEFVWDGQIRWTLKALWMGADPWLKVPSMRYPDCEEKCSWTSPIEDAVYYDTFEILKILKPQNQPKKLNELMNRLFIFKSGDILVGKYLLELGADVNDKPNGGSTFLERIVCKSNYLTRDSYFPQLSREELAIVYDLIEKEARFIPEDLYYLRSLRVNICSLDKKDAIRLLKTLAKATDQDILLKIIRTPKVRKHIEMTVGEFLKAYPYSV